VTVYGRTTTWSRWQNLAFHYAMAHTPH
jgi:hypothetical protein